MMGSNVHNGIMPSATEEILRLRKDLRLKDAEYSKDRAILVQKNEQLEQQLRDSKDREDNQRRMHETMINCLNNNDPTVTSQALSQMQASEKQLKDEIRDLQSHKRQLFDELDIKEKSYKRQLDDKDLRVKDLDIQIDRMRLDQQQLKFQFDQEKKDLNQKLSSSLKDKDQDGQKAEMKFKAENNELKNEIERLKLVNQRDIEKLKSDFELNLKEMKMIYEQEKFNLQFKVEKSTNDLSQLINRINAKDHNESSRSETVMRKREELEQEILQLHHEVEQIKIQYDHEIQQIQMDKVQAENKALKLQKQLDKIKNAPKPIKIDLTTNVDQKQQESKTIANQKEEIECLLKENDKLNDQVKKFRKEILENQDYVEKIESNERKLRQMLKDRNSLEQNQDQLQELKKQLNKEKRRNIDQTEINSSLKDDLDKIKDSNLNEMLEKDKKVAKLSKDLRETERKLLDIQSVFNSNQPIQKTHQRNLSPFMTGQDQISQIHNRNISYSPLSNIGVQQQNILFPNHQHSNSQVVYQLSPRGQNQSTLICAPIQESQQVMKQISQLEYTLLRTCQRMADQAIRMECSTCFQTFETSDFYDHIMQEHQLHHNRNQTQVLQNQSQASISNNYHTNKNQNQSKRYAEDNQSSSHQHNMLQSSPKLKHFSSTSNNQPQSQVQPPKWVHNSRSFTCLLNEIEEEEKTSTNQSQNQNTSQNNHNVSQSIKNSKKSKSPLIVQNELENTKSRNNHNTSVLQMSTVTSGNTLQSVLRSQKELKKQNGMINLSTSRAMIPQNVTVMTACRTEIQSLKRENKKMNTQIQGQEQKLNDISRDCSQIKKHVKKDTKKSNNSHLTEEIKGLLEKLVIYQGDGKDGKQVDLGGGVYTSRQYSNLPMSTDSMVELRSSASSAYGKRKKMNQKKKSIQENKLTTQDLDTKNHKKDPTKQHQSNKENNVAFEKQQTSNKLKVPKLNLQTQLSKNDDNNNSSSSTEKNDQSMIATERRSKQVKKSDELCSNSPKRFHNYFQIQQSVNDTTTNNEDTQKFKQKQPRYSPTQEYSNSKLKSVRSQTRINQNAFAHEIVDHRQSRNLNMPVTYNSKLQQQNTVSSSQNNLVLYDSSNTDIFKSKNLKYYPSIQQNVAQNQMKHQRTNESRRLDFDQQNYSLDMDCNDCDGLNNMPSSCPSLDEFEENQMHQSTEKVQNLGNGVFQSSVDEDPFITGRFCDNAGQGKQFLFKYSANNSKNTTMRTNNNLINQ